MGKKKFLVTVMGWLDYCKPSRETTSLIVETEDPVAWFLSKPKIYSRSYFTPTALLTFWEIKSETDQENDFKWPCSYGG